MAKKASKSKKCHSSSSSSSLASSTSSKRVSKEGKMVLRIRSNEITKRSTRQQRVVRSENERRPKSKTKKKKKFDAKKPKKPPTAFFYFLEDFRKEFQEQNPDVKSMREVGKACGEKWKTMTYEEKVKYYDIATEKRAEFDRVMSEYIKRKESGEDEDPEDASELDE
ncbi:high mobility group B protein 14 [Populus alba x Populus x berolinensis]|uniref:High mobility group B protein 14 n=4 Tax=Populus TaxID=3689 RepID=A0A4U5QR61_POPAL|nr:high mobility group B protein 14 [Populus alba]KAG6779369.1 hypothetical protein POTOM_015748 [Populus tomentosa]KAJ6936615.1 high mobility group B protein 14 [Populus alba x Populus x berolinensis]KAJ6936619.1 high mobility group B protein 14 [Populus alba x Populus x berolinensis]KAJ7000964.1 high mobility group B protein 14 [Populus alba x Populus x berolinensis]TKS11355.1 high mobility group B protein 14 [Populus alba]